MFFYVHIFKDPYCNPYANLYLIIQEWIYNFIKKYAEMELCKNTISHEMPA